VVEWSLALAGAAVGAGLAWVLARAHFRSLARAERSALEARVIAAEGREDELRKQFGQAEITVSELRASLDGQRVARAQAEARLADRERLSDTFKALSSDALRASNVEFLQLAREALGAIVTEARGDLVERQGAIGALVRRRGLGR
jgi:DNA recombination protein RmuC